MKVTPVILFLACLTTAFSAPAQPEEEKKSPAVVPLEKDRQVTLEDIDKETSYGDQGDADSGFLGYGNPLEGFIQTFENMMIQMRRQMEQLFGRGGAGNGTEIDIYEPFPQLPFGPDFNLDKGNTTSVTKVIDGHKVVINETEYKDEGENGGAYFKVRIIDVKPDSGEYTTEKEAEDVNRDRESMENSKENEIPKNEIPSASRFMETFDEVDAAPFRGAQYAEHYSNYLEDVEPVYQVDSNYLDLELGGGRRPYDLSHDTDVNDILAASGAPMDPDAEFVSFDDGDGSKPFQRR